MAGGVEVAAGPGPLLQSQAPLPEAAMRTRPLIIALLALAHVVPARAQPAATGAKVAVSGHVYLDRDGRPAARVLGAVQESTLTALLDTVLVEPPAGTS